VDLISDIIRQADEGIIRGLAGACGWEGIDHRH
jgi:hypothetical protein